MTQNKNKIFLSLFIAIFLLSIVTVSAFSLVGITHAQGGQSSGGTFPYPFQNMATTVNNACEPEMKTYAAYQMKDFQDFLEQNFQNKSSTNSLTELGISKYREMRNELMTAYSRYYPNQGSLQTTTGLQPNACLKIVKDTLQDARSLLRIHAIRTSGVKKTTALLEKYQSINNQLVELNQQFMNMKALLDAFAQKLPCYVKKGACIKG